MIDDDSLAAYDLSAWQAPSPPAGLADAVVRRMTQPQRPARRVWVVAACAVAAAAAVLIALLIFDRREPVSERAAAIERDESRREEQPTLAKPDQPATAPKKAVPPAPAPAPPPRTAPRSMGADIAAVQEAMRRMKPTLVACNDGSFGGTLTLDLHIGKTGKLDTLVFDQKVAFQRCIQTILNAAKFDVRSGTTFVLSFPIAFPQKAAARCDAMQLHEKGRDAFLKGMYAVALASFELSLACKWDQTLVPKLVLAACHAKNEGKARMYFPKLSSAQQPALLQRCLGNRIDPRGL